LAQELFLAVLFPPRYPKNSTNPAGAGAGFVVLKVCDGVVGGNLEVPRNLIWGRLPPGPAWAHLPW